MEFQHHIIPYRSSEPWGITTKPILVSSTLPAITAAFLEGIIDASTEVLSEDSTSEKHWPNMTSSLELFST